MLVGKGEMPDTQEVAIAQEAIEPEAEGVCGEFGQKPCRQPPKGMGMVRLDGELSSQLAIDGFDQLAQMVMPLPHLRGGLPDLVGTGERQQADIPLNDKGGCEGGTDVAFVPQDGKIMVGLQQFCGDGHIRRMGGSQREVADDPAQGDEQMEFEAKERRLLGRTRAKGGPMCGPFGTRLRRMIKLDNGKWQTIDDTVSILRHVQHRQDRPSQQG